MNGKPASSKRSSVWQRIITGAVLLVGLAVALAVGGWLLAAVAFLCLTLSLYEELNALKQGGHYPLEWTSYACLALSVPLMMSYSYAALVPLLTLMSFVVVLAVMRRRGPDLVDIMVSILPLLTVVLPGMCMFGVLDTEPRSLQLMLLLFIFSTSIGCDTAAYFVGSAIGGPKLCPNISPNKTIAGALGGLAGSVVLTVLVGWIFTRCVPDYTGFPPLWANALVGLAGGVAAQMGDLFASLVKRHCNIKDFGHIFPGHGGMMDRLDSILFTAVIIYSYRVILLGVG